MKKDLRETLRKTLSEQRIAIEEEVLIGAENINGTCSNMLRNTRRIENYLKHASFNRSRR